MRFGEKLRVLRKEKGLTQAELAKLAGVGLKTITNYEKGSTYPQNREVYGILARILGGSEEVVCYGVFYAAECIFQDVPDWARQYVGYCAYHGLMAGYGGELFGAEDPVTPAAACTVILRYLDLPDLMWDYNSACSVACDLGLITSAMTAKGTVSRGDLAVMLYRTLTGIDKGTSAGADEAAVSISSYKGNVWR